MQNEAIPYKLNETDALDKEPNGFYTYSPEYYKGF